MGTRGITKVINGGETVVAQYGQWDHYPEGQGTTALFFLSNPENVQALKAGLANVYYPEQPELDKIISDYSEKNGWMTIEEGQKFSEAYPSLTRDTGAGILEVIAKSTGPLPLVRDLEFENDELFCEGAYTVNFDDNTFTSKYNTTVTYSLDNLPSHADYLYAFREVDTVAELR